MIPYKQLSVTDIINDFQYKFEYDKSDFLSLLEQHIDTDEIIPLSFRYHFYVSTGPHKYPLQTFWWALIIHHIFNPIQTNEILLRFLSFRKQLREFYSLTIVPVVSKITRFNRILVKIFKLYLIISLILQSLSVSQLTLKNRYIFFDNFASIISIVFILYIYIYYIGK